MFSSKAVQTAMPFLCLLCSSNGVLTARDGTLWQAPICVVSEDGGDQLWPFDSTAGSLIAGEDCGCLRPVVRGVTVFVVR